MLFARATLAVPPAAVQCRKQELPLLLQALAVVVRGWLCCHVHSSCRPVHACSCAQQQPLLLWLLPAQPLLELLPVLLLLLWRLSASLFGPTPAHLLPPAWHCCCCRFCWWCPMHRTAV
jgi:hypothetical protein